MVQMINPNMKNFSTCDTTSNCSTVRKRATLTETMRKPFETAVENDLRTSKNQMRLGWRLRNWSNGTSLVIVLAIIVVVLPVTTTWALGPPRGPPHPHPPPSRHQPHGPPPRRGPPRPPRQFHQELQQHHGPSRPPIRGPNPHGFPHGPPPNIRPNGPIPHNTNHPHPPPHGNPNHFNNNGNGNRNHVTPTALAHTKHPQPAPPQNSQLRKGASSVPGDLQPAAQTLYDLRGFNIPLGQQDTQRYLRQQGHGQSLHQQIGQQIGHQRPHNQQDDHHYPRPSPQNLFHSIVPPSPQHDPRTAPLVFPSFYQQQPRPQPQQQLQLHQNQQSHNIFGHSQHLQQTKFEAPRFINTVEDPGPGHDFRPSQVDHSGSTTTENSFKPVVRGEPKTILNYKAPQVQQQQTRPANNNNVANTNSANSEEPYVYVYDDVDYEDDEPEDTKSKNKNRNSNSIFHSSTPAPSKTRNNPSSSTSTALPTPLAQVSNQGHQTPFLPTLPPHSQARQNQPNFNSFFDHDFDPRLNLDLKPFQNHNPFESVPPSLFTPVQQQVQPQVQQQQQRQRPTPTATPRPNVEIVPSSERKPPPDQSNAIPPALRGHSNNNQQTSSRPAIDDRHRRPTSVTTTVRPVPNYIQEVDNFEDNFNPPQFNRRPQPQRNQFGAVKDNDDDDDDDSNGNNGQFFQQNHPDPILIQKLNPFLNPDPFHPPSRLRPVNTIVPKNRVPQEDIVLPPHFPELEDNRTPKDEETTTHAPTRKPFDSTLRRNPNPPSPNPTSHTKIRTTQQTITRGTTATTTTTTTTTPAPRRSVTRPTKLRPSNNRYITTTPSPVTTTKRSTTPVPSFYEDTSQEYYEDLRNQNIQDTYDFDTPTKTRTPAPIRQSHLPNNYGEPEAPTGRRVRPLIQQVTPTPNAISSYSTTSKSLRINNNHLRFRENSVPTTAESPPPKKTGKPLYVAGKMLAKEGGLYAGQTIPHNHIYGAPAPLIPINNVFDRVPGILDGHVATQAPHHSTFHHSNQQRRPSHLQNQHVASEAPPQTSSYANQRLRLNKPTTTAATTSNSFGHGHVQQQQDRIASPESQAHIESHRNQDEYDQSKFRAPKNRYQTTRPPVVQVQQSQTPQQRETQKRRRPRPNQLKRVEETTALSPAKKNEVVSVHAEISEESDGNDNSNYVSDIPQAQYLSSTPVSLPGLTTTTGGPPVNLRSRRPRPRPKFQTTTPPPQAEEEKPSNIPKPPRKLKRVRPRINDQSTTPQPEYSESVSIVTQSSVKISRKPTEAPGRFSSRYREEDVPSAVSTPAGEREVSSVDTPRFTPSSKPRPTFRPPKSPRLNKAQEDITSPLPPSSKPKRIRPQQPQQQEPSTNTEDILPASILLSPKDVVMNRKPARRIPPGSASDRLKALQERRRKIAIKNQGATDDDGNGEAGPVVRRVTRVRAKQRQQQQEDYSENVEQQNNKREVPKDSAPEKIHNDIKEYEGDADEDYANTNNHDVQANSNYLNLNVRNTSEVTSEEARSILGIKIPSKNLFGVEHIITETPEQNPLQSQSPRKSSLPIFESLEDDDDDNEQKQEPEHRGEEGIDDHEEQDHYDEHKEESIQSTHSVKQSTMQQWTPVAENKSQTHSILSPIRPQLNNNHNQNQIVRESTTVSSSLKPGTRLRPQAGGSVQQKRISQSSSSSTSSPDADSPPQRYVSSAASLSKLLKRPTTTTSTNSKSSNSLFTMATEDPSLPLENIFPIVPHSITSSSSSTHSTS